MRDGQESVEADVREILYAYQIIGGETIYLPHDSYPRDVHTDAQASGRELSVGWYNGSTGYLTVKTKLVEADEVGTELTELIARGSAALLLGAALTEEGVSEDQDESQSEYVQAGNILWRDFLAMRREYADELSYETEQFLTIERG